MISTVPQFFHSQNSQCGRYTVLRDHSPQSLSTVGNCGGRIAATQQITVCIAKSTYLWQRLFGASEQRPNNRLHYARSKLLFGGAR